MATQRGLTSLRPVLTGLCSAGKAEGRVWERESSVTLGTGRATFKLFTVYRSFRETSHPCTDSSWNPLYMQTSGSEVRSPGSDSRQPVVSGVFKHPSTNVRTTDY